MSRTLVFSLVLIAAQTFGPSLWAQDAAVGAVPVQQHASRTSGPLKPGDRNCLRSTGSHIPPKKGGCLPVNGRSYTREELRRTGEPDTARALSKLDPSIQVSGH